jgi:oligopeptide transport system substrate-binding protein
MKRLFVAALAIGCAALAAPLAFGETPKQGGSAVVTFNNDLTTLDPQVGYDWQNWSVIKSIFDGLMDYKPGTTELEPDLAKEFTVSDDGLTYTFKLRDGLKFHNGRPVTAADVKYSSAPSIPPPKARAPAISA